MRRLALAFAAALAFSCAAWAYTNVIENGEMDTDANGDGLADGWTMDVHKGAEGAFALDSQVKTQGKSSQKIIHSSDSVEWVRASQAPIPAEPSTIYRFDCDVKSTCKYTLLVYEFVDDGTEKGKYLTHAMGSGAAAPEWTHVAGTVRTNEKVRSFKISLVTGSKGEAWFDGVKLVKVSEVPSLIMLQTPVPPKVDGKLDDEAWTRAAKASPFFLLGGGGQVPENGAEAFVTYDDKNLYFAFRCREAKPDQISAKIKEHNQPVHMDDCVEVFLDPLRSRQGFHHLTVNSIGTTHEEWNKPLQAVYNEHWYDPGAGAETVQKGKQAKGRDVEWAPQWQAAATVGAGEWCAEMAVPLAAFPVRPEFGDAWGCNFCRERKVGGEENSCWAYLDGATFHAPEQFGTLIFGGGTVPAPKTIKARPPKDEPPLLIPRPQKVEWRGSGFSIAPDVKIIAPKKDLEIAAQILRDDLQSRFGIAAQILASGEGIVIDCAPLADASLEAPKDHPEGYALAVAGKSVKIAGADARGALYGVSTLRQMIQTRDGKPFVRGAKINDYPVMKMRAWHCSGPRRADLDAYRRLIDVLTLLKYNTLMIEVNDLLRYERHPDLAHPDAPSKDELRRIVAYAKARKMEVIPQVQTLGHFGYVLNKEPYRKFSENAEPDKRLQFYTYCPSNPEIYPIVFDMFDEVIEVFQPERFFHIGHDEFTFVGFGKCERCKGTPPDVLFERDVKKLHDHLAQKNLKTLMWGDELLEDQHGGAPYYTCKATPNMPKDIVICDWHYRPWSEFPSLKYFKDNGFETIACGWYNLLNVYNFSSAALENGSLGYCGTTWYSIDRLFQTPELMGAVALSAENSWSPMNPKLEDCPYLPSDEFRLLSHLSEPKAAPKEFLLLDLSKWCNRSLMDNKKKTQCFELGPRYDLRSLPSGVQWLGSVPFQIVDRDRNNDRDAIFLMDDKAREEEELPDRVWQIPVGATVSSLVFLHTTTLPPPGSSTLEDRTKREPGKIGRYVVTYEDGSQEKIDLVFRQNIADWNNRLGTGLAPVVWRGKTEGGALIQICAYEWVNPRPALALRGIDVASARTSVKPVLIAITGVR